MGNDQLLAALERMSSRELRAAWREHHRAPAPAIGPDLLRRGIAWKLQARVHGGLPSSTRQSIDAALNRLQKTGNVGSPRDLRLKPGTRLVREWRSKTYHVLVTDDGFEHDGRRYESLSHIARAITGAQWSGPRFFGLRTGSGRRSDG